MEPDLWEQIREEHPHGTIHDGALCATCNCVAEIERLRPIVEAVRDADWRWDWTMMRLEARYALEARSTNPAAEGREEPSA